MPSLAGAAGIKKAKAGGGSRKGWVILNESYKISHVVTGFRKTTSKNDFGRETAVQTHANFFMVKSRISFIVTNFKFGKNVFDLRDFVQNFKMNSNWPSVDLNKFMILTVAVLKLLWNNLKCIIIRIRRILIIYMLSQYLKTVRTMWSLLFHKYKMAKLVLQRKTRRRKQAVSDWSFLLNRL